MFKHSDDDEESFFAPMPSTKLASLFDTSVALPETSSSQKLKYSAPKQPSTRQDDKSKGLPPKPETTVVLVKVVHTFKLENGAYVPQGKLGLALVSNNDSKAYSLILYKDKSKHIVNVKVNPEFTVTLQDDNYINFYDEHNDNWSLRFDNNSDRNDFLAELKKSGTHVENELHQPPVNIEKPTLPNKPKIANPDCLGPDIMSDSTETKTKASILSRMAKMGQPLLLAQRAKGNQKHDVTDSDTESDHNIRKSKKIPKRSPISEVPSSVSTVVTNTDRQNVIFPPTSHPTELTTQFNPGNNPVALLPQYQQIIPFDGQARQTIVPTVGSDMNVYFAENRTHNSEVRMNLMKLDSKIDKILEKFQKDADLTLLRENEYLRNKLSKNEIISTRQPVEDQKSSSLDDCHNLQLQLQEFQGLQEKFDTIKKSMHEVEKKNKEYELTIKSQATKNETYDQYYIDMIDLKTKYADSLKDVERLKTQVKDQLLRLEEFSTKLAGASNDCKDVEFLNYRDENAEIKHELNMTLETLQEYVIKLEQQDSKLQNLEAQFVEVVKSGEDLETVVKIQELKLKDFASYYKENSQTKKELNESLEQIKQFKAKITNQDLKLKDFTEYYQQNKTKTDDLQKQIAEQQKEIDDLKCKLEKTITEDFEKKNQELQEEITLYKNKMSLLESSSSTSSLDVDKIFSDIKQIMNTMYSEIKEIIPEETCSDVATTIVKTSYQVYAKLQTSLQHESAVTENINQVDKNDGENR